MKQLDVTRSLNGYIMHVCQEANLPIYPISAIQPIGPAGDRYLWDAMCKCSLEEEKISCFVAPCIRREKKDRIMRGSHLSLFFLLYIVFGQAVSDERVDSIYRVITNVQKLGVREMLSHQEKCFHFGEFDFCRKLVPRARNFDCEGYAYEMFDRKKIEICNIAEFIMLESRKRCRVFAFGIERMIMHLEGETNIWNTTPFKDAFSDEFNNMERDRQRKNAFLKSAFSPIDDPQEQCFADCLVK